MINMDNTGEEHAYEFQQKDLTVIWLATSGPSAGKHLLVRYL